MCRRRVALGLMDIICFYCRVKRVGLSDFHYLSGCQSFH